MATIKDLRIPSIREMSQPDLIEHLRMIRKSRMESKKPIKAPSKPKPKKEISLMDMVNSMSPDMKDRILKKIQGR